MRDHDSKTDPKSSLLSTAGSVLAAMFGVQSDKNRMRDFQSGSPTQFVVMGIAGAVLFIVAILAVVKLVLG